MNETLPQLSIIVPTHNRSELLMRLLDALAQQDSCPQAFEVVIVADGCADGTLALLAARQDLPIKVLELPGLGPAHARNAGAKLALAPLLIFLDDDVLPERGFLAAHIEAHQRYPNAAVTGPYPPHPYASQDLFRLGVRRWWTNHFEEAARPGHRLRYTDFLSGNMSISTELWHRLGGLDPAFAHAHEDYEFGIRLLKEGVPMVYAPEARAWHHEHETMTLERAFRRAFEEGRSDVLLAAKHPETRPNLRLFQWRRNWKMGLIGWLIFAGGGKIDRVASAAAQLLEPLQRRGLRSLYWWLFKGLLAYWYIRGLSRSLRSFQDWWRGPHQTIPAPPTKDALRLDLRDGLPQAQAMLDAVRPQAVDLYTGDLRLGIMGPDPCAEDWRGNHLRPFLFDHLGISYLQALVTDGALDVGDPSVDQKALLEALDRARPHFGQRRSPWVWFEQYEQWRRIRSGRG